VIAIGREYILNTLPFDFDNCGTVQCREHYMAISFTNTGEKGLKVAGIVARVTTKLQHKTPIETKIFELTNFDV
jgi:hypothetical protein